MRVALAAVVMVGAAMSMALPPAHAAADAPQSLTASGSR